MKLKWEIKPDFNNISVHFENTLSRDINFYLILIDEFYLLFISLDTSNLK
jgi:hypothetical protein